MLFTSRLKRKNGSLYLTTIVLVEVILVSHASVFAHFSTNASDTTQLPQLAITQMTSDITMSFTRTSFTGTSTSSATTTQATTAIETQTTTSTEVASTQASITESTVTHSDPPPGDSQPSKPRAVNLALHVSFGGSDNSSGIHRYVVRADPVTSDSVCTAFTYRWKVSGGNLVGLVPCGNVTIVVNVVSDGFVEAGTVEWT
jgi:hypothetical protein